MTSEIFHFLRLLANNNNREWFNEHKNQYEKVKQDATLFFHKVHDEMAKRDAIEPLKIYRIYRDVRFSNDKTPYKTHFSMFIGRQKPAYRGGYYLQIQPDNNFVGGGFWGPSKEDLFRIRQEISLESDTFSQIIENSLFKTYFHNLEGESLKNVPKDFDKDDGMIEFLKKKQFLMRRRFTDEEVMSDNFIHEVIQTFEAMRPFMNFMTNALTTDLNGESLI